jgi:hypothetical protein
MRRAVRALIITSTAAGAIASVGATAQAKPLTGVRISAPAGVRTIAPGSRISTTVTLTNARARRSGRGTVRLYLSTDGQAARGMRLVQRDTAALRPHARKKLTLIGRIPTGLRPGRYRLLVSLDARGTVFKPGAPSRRTNSETAPNVTPLVAAAAPSVVPPAVAPAPLAAPVTPAPAAPATPAGPPVTPPPVNHAPVAVDDAGYSTYENTALTVPAGTGVLANDTDADGDPLTAAITTPPSHGTVTLDADGSFTYTPTAGWVGSDHFSYVANDGTVNSAPATVHLILLTHPPTATADSYSATENELLTVDAPGVLANDDDLDGDHLTALLVTDVSHGYLNLDASDGSFTYSPDGYTGTDSFTYRVFDGRYSSDPVTVTLNVTALPPPPPPS